MDETENEGREMTDEEIEAESKAYVARLFEEQKGRKGWDDMTKEEHREARERALRGLREWQEAMKGAAEEAGFTCEEDVMNWCMEERRKREKRHGTAGEPGTSPGVLCLRRGQ